MNTYRFIRFVKEPVNRRGRIEDIIKVFFDIDDYPQNYFDEDEFLEFLQTSGFVTPGGPLWTDLKDKLKVYGVHYVLDTKKKQLVHFGLEAAPAAQPSMKSVMYEKLYRSGTLEGRSREGKDKDLHDCLKPLLQTIERIGRK